MKPEPKKKNKERTKCAPVSYYYARLTLDVSPLVPIVTPIP